MAFRFKSVAMLYKDLGRYDAIVEFTEVSIRDFIFQANKHGDFNDYLTIKSTVHKIFVNSVDRSIFRARISQGYILSVHQVFELFLRNFKDDYNELYLKSENFDYSNDSLLIKLIKIISDRSNGISAVSEFKICIYDYYRKVRNKYSHEIMSDDKIEKAFDNLKSYDRQIKSEYPLLTAPNPYVNLEFDDFILFSRGIKDIVESLNNLAAPTDEQLANFYLNKMLFSELNQNLARKKNACIGHLRNNFGIEKERAEQIISLLTSH